MLLWEAVLTGDRPHPLPNPSPLESASHKKNRLLLWEREVASVGGRLDRRLKDKNPTIPQSVKAVFCVSPIDKIRTYANGAIVGLKPDLHPRFVGRVLTRLSSESGVLRKS